MSDPSSAIPATRLSFSVKSLLAPLLGHPKASQVIKWSVYSLLLINLVFYIWDDYLAYTASLGNDATLADILEKFATTIDTVAWLGLVFLFELETYMLSDEAYEGKLPWFLFALRLLCYVSILYAAYGYTVSTLDNYQTREVAGLSDLCETADQGRSLQVNVIAYEEITADNCAAISSGPPYYQIGEDVSLIDAPTLKHVQTLGWFDISNSYTWLIVVLLIELEVWFHASDHFGSRAIEIARRFKTGFYGVLLLNVVVWLLNGYPLWAYDALLWIWGFWAIELNLAEWEQDRVSELAAGKI